MTYYLDELTHAVECRDISDIVGIDNSWHVIAAFDVEQVAALYADDCRQSSRGMALEYRVVEIER